MDNQRNAMFGFVLCGVFLLVSGFPQGATRTQVSALQAQKLIDQQHFQEALTLLDQARNEDPKNVEVLYLRGYTLYRLHDLARARQQLEVVVRFDPRALRSCYFLGRIAFLEGRPEEA